MSAPPWDTSTLNVAALTASHVALCQAEQDFRKAGRTMAADALAYADVVILVAREHLTRSGTARR